MRTGKVTSCVMASGILHSVCIFIPFSLSVKHSGHWKGWKNLAHQKALSLAFY